MAHCPADARASTPERARLHRPDLRQPRSWALSAHPTPATATLLPRANLDAQGGLDFLSVAAAGHPAGGVDGLGELAAGVVLGPRDRPCTDAVGQRDGGLLDAVEVGAVADPGSVQQESGTRRRAFRGTSPISLVRPLFLPSRGLVSVSGNKLQYVIKLRFN